MTQDGERKLERMWGDVVAAAWADPDFEARMLANPRDVCRERGMVIPDDVTVRVVRDGQAEPAEGVLSLPYPPNPDTELDDESLDAVAGGFRVMAQAGFGPPRMGDLQFFLGGRIQMLNNEVSGLLVRP